MFIDDSEADIKQIFFDNGISEDPKYGSGDIRDMVLGETIPYKRAINKFFVRVESDKAILDNDYFIKKVEECELRRTEELDNLGKGIDDDENKELVEDVNEWERLNKLGTSDYLVRTVLPVVYQGLSEIDIERPQDPVKAFAFFLLKNQKLVKLPEKPQELDKTEEEVKEESENREEENKEEET